MTEDNYNYRIGQTLLRNQFFGRKKTENSHSEELKDGPHNFVRADAAEAAKMGVLEALIEIIT